MQHIKNNKPKEIVPGITGYYAHGEKHTLGLVKLKAGSSVPEHHHSNEQITYMLEGQLDMIIDNNPCTLTDGMYVIVPSDTKHSAKAITDCKLIDTFCPVREEYRT